MRVTKAIAPRAFGARRVGNPDGAEFRFHWGVHRLPLGSGLGQGALPCPSTGHLDHECACTHLPCRCVAPRCFVLEANPKDKYAGARRRSDKAAIPGSYSLDRAYNHAPPGPGHAHADKTGTLALPPE